MIEKNEVLEQFNTGVIDGADFFNIARFFQLAKKGDKNRLRLCLERLEKEGKIYLDGQRYYLKRKRGSWREQYVTGVVRTNERGYGFLVVDGRAEDFFIPARKMGDAFQGDTVIAKRISGGKGDEVEVVKVIKRGITRLVGTFYQDEKVRFVRPDDRGYLYDIIVKDDNGASIGQKVVVDVIEFAKNQNPKGNIIKILGESLSIEAEEQSIIITQQIEEDFNKSAIDEAKSISQKVSDNDIIGALDLRKELIFTIDGETARDFDDAVSLKTLPNGNWLLGVHIADVSNYVKFGSALDKSAYERALSVYLPDRVIPMLPFELSNGICSLNEGVDRLTLSVFGEIDKEGRTVNVEFYKSVICSKRRLTYTLVQSIFDGDLSVANEYADVAPTLFEMLKLKNILAKNREKQGEIDLSVKEADVFMENGKISITEHKANDATKLIEQFMIYANEAVARFLSNGGYPAIYRVHGKPTLEKVISFRSFLRGLGIRSDISGDEPIEYKNLLDQLKGQKVYDSVNKMMLRSMQKAEYSNENIGHFGLASEYYLHFTSPIRRYPDLVVHRILKDVLDGKKSQINDLYGDFVKKASLNSSLKEKNAVLCEREVCDLYKVLYMQDYVGMEFDGVISGVTSFGVFVELENTIEGIIRIENLPRRNYHFNEDRMRLECGKFSLALGDGVKIGVISANVQTRKIEFAYLGKQ